MMNACLAFLLCDETDSLVYKCELLATEYCDHDEATFCVIEQKDCMSNSTSESTCETNDYSEKRSSWIVKGQYAG